MELTFYSNSDGEPWGLFTEGHVDFVAFEAAVAKHPDGAWIDEAVDDHRTVHTFIRRQDGGGEYPWHWCEADDPDGIAVTAVRWS